MRVVDCIGRNKMNKDEMFFASLLLVVVSTILALSFFGFAVGMLFSLVSFSLLLGWAVHEAGKVPKKKKEND